MEDQLFTVFACLWAVLLRPATISVVHLTLDGVNGK